jgi:hypothetical protein
VHADSLERAVISSERVSLWTGTRKDKSELSTPTRQEGGRTGRGDVELGMRRRRPAPQTARRRRLTMEEGSALEKGN